MTAPAPQVLGVEDVAQLLRCAETTVRDRATALGGIKLGRDWVFPSGAFFRRLDELALSTATPSPRPAPAAVLHSLPASKRAGRRQLRSLPTLP